MVKNLNAQHRTGPTFCRTILANFLAQKLRVQTTKPLSYKEHRFLRSSHKICLSRWCLNYRTSWFSWYSWQIF